MIASNGGGRRPRELLGGRVHGARTGVNTDWPEEVEEKDYTMY